ncbi:MAG: NAD(P)H-hydrate dehydratase [Nitrososphaerota archaeon]|nr:sugar kinase [Candidatus Bathyarchaeota archaeon]MDW8024185.1 NAD(P)H-hydrate dehydratase [Nitrososphaerota archaeon]
MLVVVGTIPIKGMPLTRGLCKFENGKLTVEGFGLPLINGTSALMAAASVTCEALNLKAPYAILAGDVGAGDGSKLLYKFLKEPFIPLSMSPSNVVFVMHYLKPNILYFRESVKALKEHLNPFLVADAGSMYVAKAAGMAKDFDLFTPDPGEMAFLADPDAVHPAYVRHYIFESLDNVPALIKQAYRHSNASKVLLVKGAVDYIAKAGEIIEKVAEPCIPVLEAIGGTGDTLTGIVSALIAGGHGLVDAAVKAAKINRLVGALCNPSPSTKVWEMVPHIPKALKLLDVKGEN